MHATTLFCYGVLLGLLYSDEIRIQYFVVCRKSEGSTTVLHSSAYYEAGYVTRRRAKNG
jgi:hypothetical protein